MAEIDIKKIKLNPNNPRIIKDENFKKLVQSLKELPEMAKVRPIVVNKDMMVLGGNMRLKAMQEAGWKKAPVEVVDWDEEKQRQFIIKDNVGFGDWDWNDLANNWDAEQLSEWGIDIPDWHNKEDIDVDKFFMDSDNQVDNKLKIILEYTEEEHAEVIEAFNRHTGSREQIVLKLLRL